MRRALRLAKLGRYSASPNPCVGCVIVRDGEIIGEGYHHKAGEPHAEIMAMREAKGDIAGATCYVTLEPCSHYGRTPPCAKALIEHNVARVVAAMVDPNPRVSGRGMAMLRAAGIIAEVGLEQEKAYKLNRAFFKSIVKQEPFVVVKLGMSLDAIFALSNGESKWISTAASRAAVQELRARADAVITSANTVRDDDPRLNLRYEELPEKIREHYSEDMFKQPVKVVLDSRGTLDLSQKQLVSDGHTIQIVGDTPDLRLRKPRDIRLLSRMERVYAPLTADGHIDLNFVIKFLGSRGLRSVLVEAGPTLSSAFIAAGLADELCAFIAPLIIGSQGRSAFLLPEQESLAASLRGKLVSVREYDGDVMLRISLQHGD